MERNGRLSQAEYSEIGFNHTSHAQISDARFREGNFLFALSMFALPTLAMILLEAVKATARRAPLPGFGHLQSAPAFARYAGAGDMAMLQTARNSQTKMYLERIRPIFRRGRKA
mmetsp:Transcript_108680/g.171467  ORF Transcript_108680/g.171467 Transcript_108680/m.171467 type:complete len:114 (+) Transcript_108680:117-458(+)